MPLINPPTATDTLVKINGSSVITGPLKFNAIGSPSYSPWAFNGAIVIGTYTLHFAPTGGTTFDFSFTTTVVDPFSQALAFVAAFNADATVIANGFRAYDFNNQVNELGPTLSATNQWVFVGLRAINYVVTQVSSTAGIQTNGSPTPAIVGAYLQLKNLGSPTLSSDAISKGYVDGNFLNLSGAKPMTGSLSFIIGNPMTFGLGFVPTPTGAYTLTITPSVGSPFTFTYYASTSDHNAEAPLLVQYFNADASTKTAGFRAYDAFHSAPSFGEKIAFSFGNQFGIVGPNQVSFTVAISGNGALVSLGQTYAASSTINNYNITGLKDPVNPQDAATKAFVLANGGISTIAVQGLVTQGAASNWTSRTSASDRSWFSIAYGNGIYVAVAADGTATDVMTSPDGFVWTTQTPAGLHNWQSICFGNGQFVAVASDNTITSVMTSPDGITWTSRNAANTRAWYAVTYGGGLFVAVAVDSLTTDSVMTSPDGITWTVRVAANAAAWSAIGYGNSLFIAVANSSGPSVPRVMTSPDGITWTSRIQSSPEGWSGVAYGSGLYVVVAATGSGNRVMTSPDGITWTDRPNYPQGNWGSVTFGAGCFVSVAVVTNSGANLRIMTSVDGITWVARYNPVNNFWRALCYGQGKFVAVSSNGTGNRVMTSLSGGGI